MSYYPRYDKGDWKAVCDVCGREVKASLLQKRWDGLMVCQKDFEVRHPQDFVRGVADLQAPPWTRPESSDSFVNACTTNTSIVGYAIIGCLIVGNVVIPDSVPPSSFTP